MTRRAADSLRWQLYLTVLLVLVLLSWCLTAVIAADRTDAGEPPPVTCTAEGACTIPRLGALDDERDYVG